MKHNVRKLLGFVVVAVVFTLAFWSVIGVIGFGILGN
jgi:hypothetical protein